MDNPINKIPTEVWEMIISHVESSKDLINLSKVIPTCKQIVHPIRNQWLFDQVFPLAFLHKLSTNDVLNCRLVSKRWKHGVDQFLEDNPINCPASGDNLTWKIERCHTELKYYILGETLLRKRYKQEDLEKLFVEAVNYPRNSFVGRHVNITFSTEDISKLNPRFLKALGHHIHFLKIDFDSFDPLEEISELISVLKMVPNLKGLKINKRHFDRAGLLVRRKFSKKEHLDRFFKTLMSSESTKIGLPTLETLELKIEGLNNDFLMKVIISLLKSDQLKSLTVNEPKLPNNTSIEITSLLHFSLKISRTESLNSILNFNCPNVRKLELDLTGCQLDFKILLKVLQTYQKTLNHLHVGVPDEEKIRREGFMEHKRMITFFNKSGTLKMPNIKTLSFSGYRPPSLNFICGNGFETLEYLHIILERVSFRPIQDYSKEVQRLDVIKRLGQVWSDWAFGNIPDMHSSNVWGMFPNLKCLRVSRYIDMRLQAERTFTRKSVHSDHHE